MFCLLLSDLDAQSRAICSRMSNKRNLDEIGTSSNNRTIVQKSRRRKVDDDTDEADAVITFDLIKNNRYSEKDNPPYLVYLYDTRPDYNIGEYHPLMVGKKLSGNQIHTIRTFKVSSDKIGLIFSTPLEANNFVANTALINKLDPSWRAVIPDSAIYKVVVIRDIPKELTIDEIKEGIHPDDLANIVKIERCMQRKPTNNNSFTPSTANAGQEWEESNSIKIVCRSSLPREISIYSYVSKISAYILPVRQCDNCFRYGHIKNSCKSASKCLKCGEEHTGEQADTCMNLVKCANCYGPHMANDKDECLYYFYNLEINLIRSKLKCDVGTAEHIAKSRFRKEYPDLSKQEIIAKKASDLDDSLTPKLVHFKNPYYMSSFAVVNTINSNISVLNKTSDLQSGDVEADLNITTSTPLKGLLAQAILPSKEQSKPPKLNLNK